MKFSSETVNILKNFSTINPSVLLKKGNAIRTISPQKTVMAVAETNDNFEGQAGIHDISRFLATLSLFDNPDVIFDENCFTVKGGKKRLSYTYTPENMIVVPPDKNIAVVDPEATFVCTWSDIESVVRASAILQLPEVAFISDGRNIVFASVNNKNPTADEFSVTVGENTNASEFRMIIKTDNLKLIPDDYTVTLSSKGMAHFQSKVVQYWTAIEAN